MIEYYKKALKLYKKLHVPENVLDVPGQLIPNERAWNVILGIRGTGKTTELLLWGLCLNAVAGIVIQYVRQREVEIMPRNIGTLFDVVKDPKYGYIKTITGGRWESIIYRSRKWYYCNLDDNGAVIEKSDISVCNCLAIELSEEYKSSYNAPLGDYIIVDEFLKERGYLPEEFILLNHILSTIIRDRDTAHIYLSGNLIDRYSVYFDELQLNDIIPDMNFGDHRILQCDQTYLHIYAQEKPTDKKREKVNKTYFGWKSQKLTAITGNNGMWALKLYPRPPKGDYKLLSRAYLFKNGKYLCRELRRSASMLYIFCYLSDAYNEDVHILYTCSSQNGYSPRVRYGLGYTKTDKIIKTLINAERCYFSDNSAGAFLDAYIRDIE